MGGHLAREEQEAEQEQAPCGEIGDEFHDRPVMKLYWRLGIGTMDGAPMNYRSRIGINPDPRGDSCRSWRLLAAS
jgi:hypothetical protein